MEVIEIKIRIHRDERPGLNANLGEKSMTLTWNNLQCRVTRDIGMAFGGTPYWRINIQGPSNYYDIEEARVVIELWTEAVKVAEEYKQTAPDLEYLRLKAFRS